MHLKSFGAHPYWVGSGTPAHPVPSAVGNCPWGHWPGSSPLAMGVANSPTAAMAAAAARIANRVVFMALLLCSGATPVTPHADGMPIEALRDTGISLANGLPY